MVVSPEAFRAQLTDVLIDWQTRTERCLGAAKSAGEISNSTDCAGLAAFFWIGWEGAVLRAKLERRAEPLRIFASHFRAMVTIWRDQSIANPDRMQSARSARKGGQGQRQLM